MNPFRVAGSHRSHHCHAGAGQILPEGSMNALTVYRRPLAATAAFLACGLLAGCGSSSAGVQTPAGIPSTGQTTTASSAPTTTSSATTPAASTSSSSSDLTQQAEQVYKARFALYFKTYQTGGIAPGTPAPAAFKELMTGQALTDTMTEMGQIETQGLRHKSGTFSIVAVAPSNKQMADSIVALHSCEDGRSLISTNSAGAVSHGRLVDVTSYYTHENGQLKMMYYLSKAVTSCAVH